MQEIHYERAKGEIHPPIGVPIDTPEGLIIPRSLSYVEGRDGILHSVMRATNGASNLVEKFYEFTSPI